jgi:hypothetical protein
MEVTGRTNPLENLSKYLRFVAVVRSRSVKTAAVTVVVEEEATLPAANQLYPRIPHSVLDRGKAIGFLPLGIASPMMKKLRWSGLSCTRPNRDQVETSRLEDGLSFSWKIWNELPAAGTEPKPTLTLIDAVLAPELKEYPVINLAVPAFGPEMNWRIYLRAAGVTGIRLEGREPTITDAVEPATAVVAATMVW